MLCGGLECRAWMLELQPLADACCPFNTCHGKHPPQFHMSYASEISPKHIPVYSVGGVLGYSNILCWLSCCMLVVTSV